MYAFLIVLFVLLSLLMVVVILMQAGKGQGLAGAVGGGMAGQAMFGGRGAGDFLTKATSYMAVLYLVLTLAIGMIYKSDAEEQQQSLIQQRVQEQEESQMPSALPVAPVEEGSLLPSDAAPAEETSGEEKN